MTPHPLIENPINDYDYKLKLKLNFNSSFRTLHDSKKHDHEKHFILNKWKEVYSKKCCLEDLSNEVFYEVFEYMDIYHVYEEFFNLNTRFQNLLVNSNVPVHINISTMSKSNFECAQSLNNVADHLIILPKLHSLTINNIGYIQNSTLYYIRILRLPKLKYCKIKFESKDDVELLPKSTDIFSPIECLVINHYFRLQSLNNLLSYLQQLRHLSINYLNGFDLQHIEFYPIVLKNLKYISLELDLVPFDQLEKFIKNSFYYVEVLRLTIKADFTYLDAKKWEQLIVSYMPNLRVFDINHEGSEQINQLTYHNLINQFNSSFYIEKKWCFTHQHYWQETVKSGIFYSTNPYRRKDYTFYWEFDEQVCSYIQENNLNSVKHLHICSNAISDICINYFPNVTELTITNSFQISVDPVSKTLSRIVALKQITKLVVEPYDFYFEELIDLLRCTSNLYTLKYDLICFRQNTATSIQQKEEFLHLSNINKVKRLDIRETCTLKEIKMLVNLFPQLQYLQTGMNKKEIKQILTFLLSKTNMKTNQLFFLCIKEIPKMYLRELDMLIKFQNLCRDYFIKFINSDIYLWW
ncbi:unnamed protein product [Rotaria sp. Silwood1]|nr:unnamed protein product [Rotaria sp. Silwood1]CAF0841258.1 unnamed protein product [Rotaria sp. Silwood1]